MQYGDLNRVNISSWCSRWQVSELALFGSALRDDFSPESDYDFLVQFKPAARWSLIDLVQMEEELEQLLGRSVDLVTYRGLETSRNWLRREAILSTARVIYEDRQVTVGP